MKPLHNNVLRTAGLISKRSAMFGLTRTASDGTKRIHQGIDLVAEPNTEVLAVSNGQIVGVNMGLDGYGFTITLKIDGVELYAFYAHLGKIKCKAGQKVKEGQVIGYTGSSGNARNMTKVEKGAHLHFEIRTRQIPRAGLQDRIDPLMHVSLDE